MPRKQRPISAQTLEAITRAAAEWGTTGREAVIDALEAAEAESVRRALRERRGN